MKYKHVLANYVVFCMIVLLAGCSNIYSGVYYPAQPLYALPPGSTLTLNRDLTIPANALAVFMQNGQAFVGGVDQFSPNCKFELRYKHTEPQMVFAGDFLIKHFSIQRGDFASNIGVPFRAVRYRRRLDLFGEDAPSFIVYASYFFLQSTEQPDVLRITCRHWRYWGEGRFLSLAEIQNALGEIFTLQLGPS